MIDVLHGSIVLALYGFVIVGRYWISSGEEV